jgi:hypothetical protein
VLRFGTMLGQTCGSCNTEADYHSGSICPLYIFSPC